jgi:hypothetical protein
MSKGRLCLYCGFPTGRVKKGDHLIPDAIGGKIATKDVCSRCNNDLSDIDRELCSRSPISLVASKEIEGHIAQAWDVDENDRNLLLEGRPDLVRSSFRIFPQMVVLPRGEQFRADWHELREFGIEKFHTLFKRRLRKAFWQYEHGNKKAIIFSELPYNEDLLTRYTYFPRFFVRGTVADACSTKTIELGYDSRAAKRMAMARIEAGLQTKGEMRSEVGMSSPLPTIRFFCDGGKVWRALAKIAINLLHHYCSRTEVNLLTFPRVIDEILGKRRFHPIRLSRSGFVCHSDLATIASTDGSHFIRLSWERGFWIAAMAFFGGQIGAAVKFPGPNKELWRTLDVKAPINSSDWTITPSSLVIPSKFHVEWSDLNKMIAGGGFVEIHSSKFEA